MSQASLAIDCHRLVDPGRFGAALHRARLASAESLTGLSRIADGRWLPDHLVTIERGRSDLSDREMAELAHLYALGPQPVWSAGDVELVLDRSTVSDITAPLDTRRGDRDAWCAELAQRFAAVAMFVGLDMASGPFNVTALAAAMETSVGAATDIVITQLEHAPAAIVETVAHIEDRLVVSECGILIGFAPAGSLLMTQRIGPSSSKFGPGSIAPACSLSEAVALSPRSS